MRKLAGFILLFLFSVAFNHAQNEEAYQYAYFSGGPFWYTEAVIAKIYGVVAAEPGYLGGTEPNPLYQDVLSGRTGHRYGVRVTYDTNLLSYEQLLDAFIRTVDPTDGEGSFTDRGFPFTTAVFYKDAAQLKTLDILRKNLLQLEVFNGKPIKLTITPYTTFYAAQVNFQEKGSFPYSFYSTVSGRGAYIKNVWGKVPSHELLTIAERENFESPYLSKMPFMDRFIRFVKPSQEELRAALSPLAFQVTQEKVPENAFTEGNFYNETRRGLYVDIVSGEPLFSSVDKLESLSGWPIFSRPIHKDFVVEKTDFSLFLKRIEVRSRYADSHLGYVFKDVPQLYSINGAALRFIPFENLDEEGFGELRSFI